VPVSETSPSQLKDQLTAHARALGLDAVGVTRLDNAPDKGPAGQRLRGFLDAGRHGDMTWMETTAERRADPHVLWPEARTAIMIGHSYAPDCDPMTALSDTERGVISVYAQGRDYHDVLKGKIKALASQFAKVSGADVKVFVDTAPLMEKPLAAAAGLGWQGKHTNLVSRQHGSWLFLGAILTTAELPPDLPEADHCGSCSRCLDVCPTKAFPAPYQLDARRCLAYLSIEHRGHIPEEFRAAMGNRIFGCDDCLAVCPWNKFAEASREAKYAARIETANPPLAEILSLDDAGFRARFAGTPVKRAGRDRVVRNALIAAGNSGNVNHMLAVRALLSDPSPLIRAMAVWAAYRLAAPNEYGYLREKYEPLETDGAVAHEWQRDLNGPNT
jgi:epoxyqueuosine reductase